MKRELAAAAAISLLGACATTVPPLGERGEVPQTQWIREAQLVTHVKCELQQALRRIVVEQMQNDAGSGLAGHDIDWLKDWGATVTLKLIVNEKSTFSPGISLTKPLENIIQTFPSGGNVTVGQSRSFGFGASVTTEATRTDQVGFFYTFSELVGDWTAPGPAGECGPTGGMSTDNDLKIADFMESKINLSRVPAVLERKPGKSPFSVFTYEVTFVVTKSANVTPNFKLVAISINPTGTLYNGQRIRTNDLVLTMGPVKKDQNGEVVGPSDAVRDANLAALIGRAVATALKEQEQ
jgi:hypothetical protein